MVHLLTKPLSLPEALLPRMNLGALVCHHFERHHMMTPVSALQFSYFCHKVIKFSEAFIHIIRPISGKGEGTSLGQSLQ
jgi:hypothetical protein